jgi:hypothetical protein
VPADIGTPPRPAAVYEPAPAGGAGGSEPIRAGGGSSLDIEAAAKPVGGKGPAAAAKPTRAATPRRGVVEPARGKQPAAAPAKGAATEVPKTGAAEPAPGKQPGAPAKPAATEVPESGVAEQATAKQSGAPAKPTATEVPEGAVAEQAPGKQPAEAPPKPTATDAPEGGVAEPGKKPAGAPDKPAAEAPQGGETAPSKTAGAEPPAPASDPLVVAKIQGGKKGVYWPEGTPQFKKNAGSLTGPPNEKYVVLPKSQAEALGFRPNGAPPKGTIAPRTSGGKQIESSGAGRDMHPITGRTTRKPPVGPSSGNEPLEMPQADPSAEHAFPRTIGADVKQAQGYNELLNNGELGILRPGNISTGGVDAITVSVEGGKAKIYLNDFTTPGTGKPAKATHADWRGELLEAAKSDRLNFGEPPDNQPIKDAVLSAIENGEVYIRPVTVELPATATPGPRPTAGTIKPTLEIGAATKLSGS